MSEQQQAVLQGPTDEYVEPVHVQVVPVSTSLGAEFVSVRVDLQYAEADRTGD